MISAIFLTNCKNIKSCANRIIRLNKNIPPRVIFLIRHFPNTIEKNSSCIFFFNSLFNFRYIITCTRKKVLSNFALRSHYEPALYNIWTIFRLSTLLSTFRAWTYTSEESWRLPTRGSTNRRSSRGRVTREEWRGQTHRVVDSGANDREDVVCGLRENDIDLYLLTPNRISCIIIYSVQLSRFPGWKMIVFNWIKQVIIDSCFWCITMYFLCFTVEDQIG